MHRALMTAALVAAVLVVSPSPQAGAAAGFGDVAADAFYAAPVQWMADAAITTGTSAGCFSPDRNVTRAEVAVFIHRYAGEPSGGSEPFTDVGPDRYYTEAVAWMVANDITTGTTSTTFAPDRDVTRAEFATFLWRFRNEPAGGSETFSDVGTGRYYSDAVAWMVANDITTGTSPNTFSPNRPVTRGEVATFMYRVAGEPNVTVSSGGACRSTGSGEDAGDGSGGSGGDAGDDSGGSTNRFETLPIGSTLPTGAECADRVRSAAEIRPGNAVANNTRGSANHPTITRVDGDFTGTTDEILQWVACKWGIDEDIVRAQAVKESWWHMSVKGDRTGGECHWSVAGDVDGSGNCPESLGILQVRFPYHRDAFDSAAFSTAYNADYTYGVWRACYEGGYGWLGGDYAAGDLWGCLGVWFAGRWYTSDAVWYIGELEGILADRTWESSVFINDPGPG